MKIFTTIFTILACIAIIFLGNMHWKDEISKAAGSGKIRDIAVQEPVEEEKNQDLVKVPGNWPEESAALYKKKAEANQKFKIVFAGPDAKGWSKEAISKVKEAYGDTIITSVVQTEGSSLEYVRSDQPKKLMDEQGDMIILESFTLADNSHVALKDSFYTLTKIIDDVKKNKKDTQFVLQPPNPIYGAKYYPGQVNELKKYAKENKISYINHWAAWPEPSTAAIKEDLTTEQSPNDKGYKLWGDYVADYLTGS
ncbi:SGNH/GDSL hydrolase family protein [Peribacillus sp. B-H-3]|uniref:SGNH/GDSL hydrolase family protein n=1 Tax=Peribacillus sp. B-H-3 TaxID=3400420 RepID=UPI003B01684B